MAKENVDLPMISEVTTSSKVELRRYSAGIESSGNNEKKVVVPHYLRASTGSCHDFCKYGRNNVEEAKEKLSMIKRAGRQSLSRSSEDIIGGIMTSVDSKPRKMSTLRHSQSVDSELQISETNKVDLPKKSSGSQKAMWNEILVNTCKTSLVWVKASFLPKSHISSIPETGRRGISSSFEIPSKSTSKRVINSPISTSERLKTHPISTSEMVNTSSKSVSKMKQTSSKVSSFQGKEMELSDEYVTSLNPNVITIKTISSRYSSDGLGGQKNSKIKMKKKEASTKSSRRGIGSVGARKQKGLKIAPHLMNQPKPLKVEFEEHNNEEKTLYVTKMESANQTSQSDQNESQGIELPLSNQNESQKFELPLSNSLSTPKFSPPSKSQSSSQEESEYANSEFDEDACLGNQGTEYSATVESLEAEENGKLQKDGIVCSEDKECRKLRVNLMETQIEYMANVDTLEAKENGKPQKDGIVFSEDRECQNLEGKLVGTRIEYTANLDILEADKNEKPQKEGIACSEDKECQMLGGKLVETQIGKVSPKSLKFQRGIVLGDNTTDVKVVAVTGSEKAALRHEDMHVRKDGQGLYNNVTEETESKLIETRKGMVKALIDAFETVISRREEDFCKDCQLIWVDFF